MSYATVMVHLQLGRSNIGLLQVVGDLIERFGASVIGIAASQPIQVVYADGCYVPGNLVERDRDQVEAEIQEAAAEFRTALQARAKSIEWRSVITNDPVASYVACQARSADLIVTGVVPEGAADPSRRLRIGDLVMQAGRPVLVVPSTAERLKLERVAIGWKDTCEARRAVADALPLLQQATRVSVFEIAEDEEHSAARVRCDDVAAWLARHGVTADTSVSAAAGNETAAMRSVIEGADLVVSGAYGHSRVREWVLGGVTRDLLLKGDRFSLVAH
jgi:nucleotide-binding universal stress UspA family protein